MSLRNAFVSFVALSSLLFLAACGGSGTSIPNPTPTPTGSFSKSNLNGTYVFSVSGTDSTSAPFAIVGTLTADGNGGITGGAFDINTLGATPGASLAISNGSSYTVGVDGRGTATLVAPSPFPKIGLDFVLQDSSHGLVIEYDGVATGSGTIDLQTAGATPTGTYAFSFSGADPSGSPFATVGNFTIGAKGAITGFEDFNDNSFAYTSQSLTGTVVAGPTAIPGTTLTTTQFTTQTYDVFVIDPTHLKFIEMDLLGTFSGDAFAQTTTTVPTGTLAFTAAGFLAGAPAAIGGVMITDGSGNISTATEDSNNGGSVSPSSQSFTATYAATASQTGRSTISFAAPFVGGSLYAAYPSAGGLLMLEIDNSGIMAGAATAQTSTSFSTSQGYGLNLSGANLGNGVEVDDIAEFAANSSGTTITGVIDENFQPNGSPILPLTLSGTYSAPDSNGRGQIIATAGSGSNTTLNGGFGLTFYATDGTTFPFIETDTATGQVATGVFLQQNPAAASSAAAHSQMFLVRPLVSKHARRTKQK
jgi:hypothetical protein